MRIKKYIVDTMPEAMQMIRQELGEQAMILNTKKIKTGGFMGLFKRQQIEVIAAVDNQKIKKDKEGKSPPPKQENVVLPRANVGLDTNNRTPEFTSDTRSLPEQTLAEESMHGAVHTLTKLKESVQDTPHIEKEQLYDEIRQMKQFMLSMIGERSDQLASPIKEIHQRLEQQEIKSDIRSEILTALLQQHEKQPLTALEAHDLTKQHLQKMISPKFTPVEQKQASFISFVGPTGVGKTTTIAKLAADTMLSQNKKVGFITADTYRIAAVDQLKTYASILKIPIEVIFSPEELEEAMMRLQDCDLIFMDTAGRNYLQQKYLDEIRTLLPAGDDIQINLVLSLTSKYEDILQIIQKFKELNVDQMILTKVDETVTYGSILNLINDCSIPVTYLTNGQDVPDDIIKASPDIIIEYIMGEDAHERSS